VTIHETGADGLLLFGDIMMRTCESVREYGMCQQNV
jgi:hypothetical protein